MVNIKFVPRFSIEIPADTVLFKIIDNKLYVQTRKGISETNDLAVLDIISSNEALVKVLEQRKQIDGISAEKAQNKITDIIQTIPGVVEGDIWTVYDITNVKGNVKLEEVPKIDTIDFVRPFHGNNIVDCLAISELGFGYLGFKDTVVKNEEGHAKLRERVKEKLVSKKVSQLGFLVEEKSEIQSNYEMITSSPYYDTVNREINLIYYDLQEKTLKYFPNVVTLTHQLNCEYPDSLLYRSSLKVHAGAKYFIIRDKEYKCKGNSKDDVYLIEAHTGNCRKITFPDSIEPDTEAITSEKLLQNPDAVKISQDIVLTRCKIDKIESCLLKVQNDEFKQKVNDDELYDIICQSISEQKSILKVRNLTQRAKLETLIKPTSKEETKSLYHNMKYCEKFDDIVLDNEDHLHLIYATNGLSYEPKQFTIVNIKIDSLSGCNITKEMGQLVKFTVKSDTSTMSYLNKWMVMNSEYYLFTSRMSFFNPSGKLEKYYNTDVSTISILNDKAREVVTCSPDELYSDNDNIYYHTSGVNIKENTEFLDDDENMDQVTKIFCYNERVE